MISIVSNNQLMLEKSADFLWAKQQAHLDNISNVETPFYKVKTVTFEEKFSELLDAHCLKRTHSENVRNLHTRERVRELIESATWDEHEDSEVTRMDENGVNILEQSVEMVRTAYQLQYTYQAMTNDFSIMGAVIAGR